MSSVGTHIDITMSAFPMMGTRPPSQSPPGSTFGPKKWRCARNASSAYSTLTSSGGPTASTSVGGWMW